MIDPQERHHLQKLDQLDDLARRAQSAAQRMSAAKPTQAIYDTSCTVYHGGDLCVRCTIALVIEHTAYLLRLSTDPGHQDARQDAFALMKRQQELRAAAAMLRNNGRKH